MKTEPIKIVLLDFDGTIGDSRQLITDTMLETIEVLGLEKRSREQCAAMIGLPLKETFTQLIPMTDEMGRRCAEVYSEIFFRNNVPDAVLPFPHVVETIHELHRRGLLLTIASSRHRESLVGFVNEMGLGNVMAAIRGVQDVENGKPHPEMVYKTLERFGLLPHEALVVGDARFDILMGKAAGAHTCGVSYGNGGKTELQQAGAEYIIDDFAELLQLPLMPGK